MIHTRQGRSGPPEEMIQKQAQLDQIVVLMSIEYVQTREAASRIYYAEQRGLRRPIVIEKASRRLDDITKQHIPKVDVKSAIKET